MPNPPQSEPEIVAPVALADARGRLNPHAVGWARQPLIDGRIANRWGRRKRWNFWAVYGPTHIFAAAIADADYLGTVFAYLIDRRDGSVTFAESPRPLAAGLDLGDDAAAAATATMGARRLAFEPAGRGTTLDIDWPGFAAGRCLRGRLDVDRAHDQESLNVVIPWDRKRFHVTSKQVALPAHGTLELGDHRATFPAGQSWASFDMGRGVWPYASSWNWCTANGSADDGTPLGINLGARWTDGTPMTENGFVLGGRAVKTPAQARFEYDSKNLTDPWTIATDDEAVVMTFTPAHRVDIVVQAVVLQFRIHQILGTYAGSVKVGDRRVGFSNLLGIAEDHYARW